MKCSDKKNGLIWIQRVWNQPDGSADNRNLSVYIAKTHFFFPPKQYADPQSIFLGREQTLNNSVKQYATGIVVKSYLSFRREIMTTFIWKGLHF